MKLRYYLIAALCGGLASPLMGEEAAVPATAAEQAAAAPVITSDTVLVTVNGRTITPVEFQAYRLLRQRPEPANPAQAQMLILNELVNIYMVSEDAESRDLMDKPGSAAILDVSRRIAMTEMAVQDVAGNYQASEEAIQQAYEKEFANQSKEYKARHILVKEEDEAKDLIAKLDEGADFAELATAHSTGPTGPNGGDLGWFSADSMVEPFAEAVKGMDKGAYTKAPVKTQFGWHVILLEDVRDPSPPALADVRDQIELALKQQALADYMESLRDKAVIEVPEQAQSQEQTPQTDEASKK